MNRGIKIAFLSSAKARPKFILRFSIYVIADRWLNYSHLLWELNFSPRKSLYYSHNELARPRDRGEKIRIMERTPRYFTTGNTSFENPLKSFFLFVSTDVFFLSRLPSIVSNRSKRIRPAKNEREGGGK